jgi:hypothetical protein
MLKRVQHDGTGKVRGLPLEFTLDLDCEAMMTGARSGKKQSSALKT